MLFAEKHALRGYDAVHLAVACEARAAAASLGVVPPTFLSCDKDLNAAAGAEGFAVDDPNAH